jgi:hypothetical protein
VDIGKSIFANRIWGVKSHQRPARFSHSLWLGTKLYGAEQAQLAGMRPCKVCRPTLATG